MAGIAVNRPLTGYPSTIYAPSGQALTKKPTGPMGEMGYVPPENHPAPTMFRDPNSLNEYQWDPVNNRYTPFSTGVDPGDRALSFLQKASGAFGGFGAGAGNGSGVPAPLGPPPMPHVALDTASIDAADRAAFARAKDTTGDITQSGLKALRDEMGSRNILGSSIDANAEASVINQGMKNLSEVPREQAIQRGARATDLAKTSYSGDISQRGQDVTMRGQDISAAQAAKSQQASQQLELLRLLFSGATSLY